MSIGSFKFTHSQNLKTYIFRKILYLFLYHFESYMSVVCEIIL